MLSCFVLVGIQLCWSLDSFLRLAPALLLPFPKFFSCHRSENSLVSPVIATDPKTPLSKSFTCHTSETPPGGGTFFKPKSGRLGNASLLSPATHHLPQHSSAFFSYCCALFCAYQKLNSFVFMRLRTLCRKPPGVGVSFPSFLHYLIASLLERWRTPRTLGTGQGIELVSFSLKEVS